MHAHAWSNIPVLHKMDKMRKLTVISLLSMCRYEIITSCWHINPTDRPSFSDLVVRLRDYWDDEHFYVVQDFQAS